MQAIAEAPSPTVIDAVHAVTPARSCTRGPLRSKSLLLLLFVISLPFVNPWVRGDGVGYYAYARSLLIQHNLDFSQDWLRANPSFIIARVDQSGAIAAGEYTPTGHIDNHFSVGPAILWAPLLSVAHAGVLVGQRLGFMFPADGFSRPYRLAMALGTVLYGFAGLLFAFDLSRQYFDERYALLATLGVWFASSLPVYMYFNPSWSHAHSAFAVSLFLWYWNKTRNSRTLVQWALLAGVAGLMINIYYPNAILLLVVGWEAGLLYLSSAAPSGRPEEWASLLRGHVLFAVMTGIALLPTLVTRWIIYGHFAATGYPSLGSWNWTSPNWAAVLFSSDHGLLSWTPILGFAIAGLVLCWHRDHILISGALLSFVGFYYFIASYPNWDGLSSFGNRFFVSLTPIFILGLAGLLQWADGWIGYSRAMKLGTVSITFLALWNCGLIFQWGTQMIPARGPISWRVVMRNQYTSVPIKLGDGIEAYFSRRNDMMRKIESEDLERHHRPATN